MEQNNIVAAAMANNPAFEVDCAAMAKALAFMAKHIVERRNTIPILSHVEIMATGNAVRIRANDLDMMATITLAATVERAGVTTLSAFTLNDTLKKADKARGLYGDGPRVTFAANGDGKALIVSGRMRQMLNTLPADDFPVIAATEAKHDWLVECGELAGDWNLVRTAISTEETRYYLNGICIDPTGEMLAYAATDGHRLSVVRRPHPVEGMTERAIVPRKAVAAILQAIKGLGSNSIGEMSLNATKLRFTAGNVEIYTKLIDGTFPDYGRVIPPACGDLHIVDVASSELATHCKAASGKSPCLHLQLAASGSRAGQTDPEGRWAQPLVATYQGEGHEIGFNANYLGDFAKLAPALRLAFADAGAPTRVTSPDLPQWEGMLMPMRINGELPAESVVEFAPVMAAPGQAADLFGVETSRNVVIGIRPGPRAATQAECIAYMTDYARRLGKTFDRVKANGCGSIALLDCDGNEIETFAMPHSNAVTVTVETLDDEGNWSAPRPCLNAKGEIAAPVQKKERKAKAPKAKPAPIAVASSPAPLSAETEAREIIPADPIAREAIASGRMQIIAIGSFGDAIPVEAPTAQEDEIGPMGPDNAEIALDAPNALEIDGNETATPDIDPMEAIMVRLEALEARLSDAPTPTPIAEQDSAPVAREGRSPERLVQVIHYLARRKARESAKASDDLAIARQDVAEAVRDAQSFAKRGNELRADLEREKAKRAKSVERSREHYRLAKRALASRRELTDELQALRERCQRAESELALSRDTLAEREQELEQARADLAKAKAAPPTYFDTEGREHQDARAMATERARQAIERAERIEGRLAQAEATVARQDGAIGAMEGKFMEMTGRALRAETALQAIDGRKARDGQPYTMAAPTVCFRQAA